MVPNRATHHITFLLHLSLLKTHYCFSFVKFIEKSELKQSEQTNKKPLTLSCIMLKKHQTYFRDTHREKAPSNKTPTLSKSMNMDN